MLNSAFRRLGAVLFLLLPYQVSSAFSPLPAITAAAVGAQSPAPLPVLYFWTPARTVASGARLNFSWSSKNVTGCWAAGGWSGSQALNGSFQSGPMLRDQQFRLTCNGAGGSVTRTINITVESEPAWSVTEPEPSSSPPVAESESSWSPTPSVSGVLPTVYFWTPKRTVTSGTSISLSWTSKNATSCRGEGAWSGSKAVGGSYQTGPILRDQQYRLICSGPGGSFSRSIDVTLESGWSAPTDVVSPSSPSDEPSAPTSDETTETPYWGPAPTLYFWTPERTVPSGTRINLSWKSTNMTSCRASGAWSGEQDLYSSYRTEPVLRDQEYRLTCSGPGGSVTRSISVAVTPGSTSSSDGSGSSPSWEPAPAPEEAEWESPPADAVALSLSVDNEWVDRGGAVTLTWSSSGADSCIASGDWSGSKSRTGSQRFSALDEDQTFSLACSAGSVTEVATVGVSIRQILISWEAPRENVDGSPLTDLAGYRLYVGNQSGSYQSTLEFGAAQTEARLDLARGSHFFALKAINAAGVESDFSREISKYMR